MSNIPECITKTYSSKFTIEHIGEITEGEVYYSTIPHSRSGVFIDIVKDNQIIKSYSNLEAIDFLAEKFPSILD